MRWHSAVWAALLAWSMALTAGCGSTGRMPVTSYNLGIERWEADDPQGAREALDAALEHDPDDALAQYHYGLLCAQLGDHDEAALALERAVALQPRAPEYWTDLAVVYHNQGREDDANRALDKALALKPTLARPHFYRGLQAYSSGDHEKAADRIRHAAQLDPGYQPAREWLDRMTSD